MKFLMVVYILVAGLFFISGMYHDNDTDKNGYFKTNWRIIVCFLMLVLSPIPAKIVGLI